MSLEVLKLYSVAQRHQNVISGFKPELKGVQTVLEAQKHHKVIRNFLVAQKHQNISSGVTRRFLLLRNTKVISWLVVVFFPHILRARQLLHVTIQQNHFNSFFCWNMRETKVVIISRPTNCPRQARTLTRK